VSLYLGTRHPTYMQPRIASTIVRDDNANWLLAQRLQQAVGITIRAHLVADMLRAIDHRRPVDEAIGCWAAKRGHRVAYSWPSIVDHLDVEPTITSRLRRAWRAGTRHQWTSLSRGIAQTAVCCSCGRFVIGPDRYAAARVIGQAARGYPVGNPASVLPEGPRPAISRGRTDCSGRTKRDRCWC
jgi:hypothetical protein